MSDDNAGNETFVASQDLDLQAHENACVIIGSTGIALSTTAGAAAAGILQSKPKSGESGTVKLYGVTRARAGAATTVGMEITSADSGWTAEVGSGEYILGVALTVVASGGFYRLHINHAGYKG